MKRYIPLFEVNPVERIQKIQRIKNLNKDKEKLNNYEDCLNFERGKCKRGCSHVLINSNEKCPFNREERYFCPCNSEGGNFIAGNDYQNIFDKNIGK